MTKGGFRQEPPFSLPVAIGMLANTLVTLADALQEPGTRQPPGEWLEDRAPRWGSGPLAEPGWPAQTIEPTLRAQAQLLARPIDAIRASSASWASRQATSTSGLGSIPTPSHECAAEERLLSGAADVLTLLLT